MAHSGQQIVGRIKERIRQAGGVYQKWVVGTSKQPRESLFTEHKVRNKGDLWIFMKAESAAVARKVRAFLTKRRGMVGTAAAADPAAEFVYAYKKAAHTKP